MRVIFRRKSAGVNLPGLSYRALLRPFLTVLGRILMILAKNGQKLQYSSKLGRLTPVDFLLEIIDIESYQNQLFISKKG